MTLTEDEHNLLNIVISKLEDDSIKKNERAIEIINEILSDDKW